jgi:hypothetical protein
MFMMTLELRSSARIPLEEPMTKAVVMLAAALLLSGGALAVALSTSACEDHAACTPEEKGLGNAATLAIRHLGVTPGRGSACERPRIEVVASAADLERTYADLRDGGLDGGDTAVDFARERVIVRQGVYGQGISWAVAQGETAIVGLLACKSTRVDSPACYEEVIAIPAVVTRVEARSCDPVGCGGPIR